MAGKGNKNKGRDLKKCKENFVKIRWGFDRRERKSKGNKKGGC